MCWIEQFWYRIRSIIGGMNKREERELHLIESIAETVEQIKRLLIRQLQVVAFQVMQTTEDKMANSITGIIVGQKGSFNALPVPAGSIIPPNQVPAWVTDNPLAVASASADGLSVTVTVDPTALPNTTFVLTVSVTRTDGAIATGSATVPLLPAPPPPPVEVSSFDINQTA